MSEASATPHSDMQGAPVHPGRNNDQNAGMKSSRINWVDCAKGWCIILVVMMHSALGVSLRVGDTGWLHSVVVFAKPFRMPDFFLVAGLFAAKTTIMPLRTFFDQKILHFFYFYSLWVFILVFIKEAPLLATAPGGVVLEYLESFIVPNSAMWFIYLLPLLFLTVRIVAGLPRNLVLAGAFALHVMATSVPEGGIYAMTSSFSGAPAFDSYALFLVYFMIGHYARDAVFRFAKWVELNPRLALGAILLWAVANHFSVVAGLTEIPGLTMVFGLAGASALIAFSVLISQFRWSRILAYCGSHSLIIYLAFILPMAAARGFLLKWDIIKSVGWLSVIIAAVAIITPLVLERLVRNSVFSFLFSRPAWAKI